MKQLHLNIASILSQNVLNGIAHVSDLEFSRLVNQLLWSERIFIYGSGKSRVIGEMFSMRLSSLGKKTFFSNQNTAPSMNSDDILLIISESGSSSLSTLYAHQAKNIGASITTLCLPYDLENKKHLHNISDLCITINPHLNQTEQNQLFRYYPEINMFPLGNGFEISSLFLLESVIASLMQQTL
ncbi:MAG: SIS domain-containing protein [Mariprofundaceae bacterium]|nr:SIS domain-containing protein [Mariprofundaceae bacterium]